MIRPFTIAWSAAVLVIVAGLPVHAAAPIVGTQAPAYYRVMIGDIEVTALCDGINALPASKFLTHATTAQIDKSLAREFLSDPVDTSFNAFLINTGQKLVLIDTGAGQLMGPGSGQLAANLRSAGYQPEQVDEIYLTHMHPDHLGGLMAGGQRAFPNATVRAAKSEADYWLSAAQLNAAPPAGKGTFQNAMNSLNPYIAAGKFSTFDGDMQLIPGITARASHGHTPGHTSYVVTSHGQTLVVWGDLVHVGAVQFAHPEVALKFDVDSAAAVAQRRAALRDAAMHGYWVAGAHLAFPGIGHVRAESNGYAWVPANYAKLP